MAPLSAAWVVIMVVAAIGNSTIVWIMKDVITSALKHAKEQNDMARHLLRVCIPLLFVTWNAYPVAYITAQLQVISPRAEEFVVPILDGVAKVILCNMVVAVAGVYQRADARMAQKLREQQLKLSHAANAAASQGAIARSLIHEMRLPVETIQAAADQAALEFEIEMDKAAHERDHKGDDGISDQRSSSSSNLNGTGHVVVGMDGQPAAGPAAARVSTRAHTNQDQEPTPPGVGVGISSTGSTRQPADSASNAGHISSGSGAVAGSRPSSGASNTGGGARGAAASSNSSGRNTANRRHGIASDPPTRTASADFIDVGEHEVDHNPLLPASGAPIQKDASAVTSSAAGSLRDNGRAQPQRQGISNNSSSNSSSNLLIGGTRVRNHTQHHGHPHPALDVVRYQIRSLASLVRDFTSLYGGAQSHFTETEVSAAAELGIAGFHDDHGQHSRAHSADSAIITGSRNPGSPAGAAGDGAQARGSGPGASITDRRDVANTAAVASPSSAAQSSSASSANPGAAAGVASGAAHAGPGTSTGHQPDAVTGTDDAEASKLQSSQGRGAMMSALAGSNSQHHSRAFAGTGVGGATAAIGSNVSTTLDPTGTSRFNSPSISVEAGLLHSQSSGTAVYSAGAIASNYTSPNGTAAVAPVLVSSFGASVAADVAPATSSAAAAAAVTQAYGRPTAQQGGASGVEAAPQSFRSQKSPMTDDEKPRRSHSKEQLAAPAESLPPPPFLSRKPKDGGNAAIDILSLDLKRVSLGNILQDAVSILRLSAQRRGIAIEAEARSVPESCWSDPSRLRFVMLTFLAKALSLCPQGGHVEVRATSIGHRTLKGSDSGQGGSGADAQARAHTTTTLSGSAAAPLPPASHSESTTVVASAGGARGVQTVPLPFVRFTFTDDGTGIDDVTAAGLFKPSASLQSVLDGRNGTAGDSTRSMAELAAAAGLGDAHHNRHGGVLPSGSISVPAVNGSSNASGSGAASPPSTLSAAVPPGSASNAVAAMAASVDHTNPEALFTLTLTSQYSTEMAQAVGGSQSALHFAKRIVETLGGEAGVVSVKGSGTMLYFDIPAFPALPHHLLAHPNAGRLDGSFRAGAGGHATTTDRQPTVATIAAVLPASRRGSVVVQAPAIPDRSRAALTSPAASPPVDFQTAAQQQHRPNQSSSAFGGSGGAEGVATEAQSAFAGDRRPSASRAAGGTAASTAAAGGMDKRLATSTLGDDRLRLRQRQHSDNQERLQVQKQQRLQRHQRDAATPDGHGHSDDAYGSTADFAGREDTEDLDLGTQIAIAQEKAREITMRRRIQRQQHRDLYEQRLQDHHHNDGGGNGVEADGDDDGFDGSSDTSASTRNLSDFDASNIYTSGASKSNDGGSSTSQQQRQAGMQNSSYDQYDRSVTSSGNDLESAAVHAAHHQNDSSGDEGGDENLNGRRLRAVESFAVTPEMLGLSRIVNGRDPAASAVKASTPAQKLQQHNSSGSSAMSDFDRDAAAANGGQHAAHHHQGSHAVRSSHQRFVSMHIGPSGEMVRGFGMLSSSAGGGGGAASIKISPNATSGRGAQHATSPAQRTRQVPVSRSSPGGNGHSSSTGRDGARREESSGRWQPALGPLEAQAARDLERQLSDMHLIT